MRATALAFTLLLPLTLVLPIRADEPAVPADFRLVAQYGSGLSDWKSWMVTIDADGTAVQDTYLPGSQKSTKSLTLPAGEMQRLVRLIGDMRFFELAGTYAVVVTDNPTLSLRVTSNEATHEVVVYAPGHLTASEEVRRFLVVWNEVLRRVPPPNPEQRAP